MIENVNFRIFGRNLLEIPPGVVYLFLFGGWSFLFEGINFPEGIVGILIVPGMLNRFKTFKTGIPDEIIPG